MAADVSSDDGSLPLRDTSDILASALPAGHYATATAPTSALQQPPAQLPSPVTPPLAHRVAGWLSVGLGAVAAVVRTRRASAPYDGPTEASGPSDVESGLDQAASAAAFPAAAAAGCGSSAHKRRPSCPAKPPPAALSAPGRSRDTARAFCSTDGRPDQPPQPPPAAASHSYRCGPPSSSSAASSCSAASAPEGAPQRLPLPPRLPSVLRLQPDNPDRILFISPSARASMWTAQRGSRWSLRDYRLKRHVYEGYNSDVWTATCMTSGSEVVLKVYAINELSDFLRHQAMRELQIHSSVRHPDVVQLLAAFQEEGALVLVLENMRGGCLSRARRKLGGRMSEAQAVHLVILPLLRALSYLHEHGIVHRDIKPDNLLYSTDWRCKLADFGVSVQLAQERAVTRTGSLHYQAPEVLACPLKKAPADNKDSDELAYGFGADIWSLGVLLYELLVGFTPFPGGSARVKAADIAGLAYPTSISAEARTFIAACLQPTPSERPTAHQLLGHSWVRSVAGGVSPTTYVPTAAADAWTATC